MYVVCLSHMLRESRSAWKGHVLQVRWSKDLTYSNTLQALHICYSTRPGAALEHVTVVYWPLCAMYTMPSHACRSLHLQAPPEVLHGLGVMFDDVYLPAASTTIHLSFCDLERGATLQRAISQPDADD